MRFLFDTKQRDITGPLNNLELAADDLNRMRAELARRCGDVFGGTHLERVYPVINNLVDTQVEFTRMLDVNVGILAAALLEQLKPMVDDFAEVSYTLTEAEYAANSVNDPFIQESITTLEKVIMPLKVS